MSIELDETEAAEMFSDLTMRYLGITGAEFLARWDVGAYSAAGFDDVPGLVDVWMVMGLVRVDS